MGDMAYEQTKDSGRSNHRVFCGLKASNSVYMGKKISGGRGVLEES